jgi:8-oxo-dGTP pyrophosphatase MutT (NUDIX family)
MRKKDQLAPVMAETVASVRSILQHRQRRKAERADKKPAAVLLPLLEVDGEPHLLFTLRTDKVRSHKGQVSFPGGGHHAEDVDLTATALRETHEEIGIEPRHVEVLGALDDLVTFSGYVITPFVGVVQWPLELITSEFEIADVFWVPLRRLLDPSLCRLEEFNTNGRRYYPIYYFEGGRHLIWGVTGQILSHFLQVAFDWCHPSFERERCTAEE